MFWFWWKRLGAQRHKAAETKWKVCVDNFILTLTGGRHTVLSRGWMEIKILVLISSEDVKLCRHSGTSCGFLLPLLPDGITLEETDKLR